MKKQRKAPRKAWEGYQDLQDLSEEGNKKWEYGRERCKSLFEGEK